jgi:hypothetical protein
MAYSTGSASDLDDLMNKLQTFAGSNGFTVDNHDATANFLSLSRSADNLFVTFYWGGLDDIMIWQSLAYSAGQKHTPWGQTDDSGNGDGDTSSPETGRNVSQIGNGPFTAYYFFAYTNPHALFVVLEYSPGLYRHFGFGSISKSQTWTGGAWAAGHVWNRGNAQAMYDVPNSGNHTVLTDAILDPGNTGYSAYSNYAGATVHIEGFQTYGQPTGGKWGHCVRIGATTTEIGTDRGSTQRIVIQGGIRGGPLVSQLGHFMPDLSNGFIPIIPTEVFAIFDGATSQYKAYYLGTIPNLGQIHLQGIDAAQEITVGADTWKAFPAVRKSNVGGNNMESRNFGLIYKKVT